MIIKVIYLFMNNTKITEGGVMSEREADDKGMAIGVSKCSESIVGLLACRVPDVQRYLRKRFFLYLNNK